VHIHIYQYLVLVSKYHLLQVEELQISIEHEQRSTSIADELRAVAEE
jgi:hypothetical protein